MQGTQVEKAAAGSVTPEMQSVARGEGLDVDRIRQRVAGQDPLLPSTSGPAVGSP